MYEITGLTWFTQADDVPWHLTHFQCMFFIFSWVFFSYFTTLRLNLLPHSNPRAWFYFDDKCSDTKIKESVACKENKAPLYFQLHTPRYVQRFKRDQMPSLISFRVFFNLKVWFLWLLINPYPMYLQTKDLSYQNRFHIPLWMVWNAIKFIYTKLIIVSEMIALQLWSFFMGFRLLGQYWSITWRH